MVIVDSASAAAGRPVRPIGWRLAHSIVMRCSSSRT